MKCFHDCERAVLGALGRGGIYFLSGNFHRGEVFITTNRSKKKVSLQLKG